MDLNDPAVVQLIPGAFSPEDVEWCESNFPALSGDQLESFCSIFESVETVRLMELDTSALAGSGEEFLCASAWHAARGRPELSAKYKRLAAVCHQVLSEKLN